MKYSISFLELDYQALIQHLFTDHTRERAAYLLCKLSSNEEERRLLVREVIPVGEEDTIESSEVHLKIRSRSFIRAMKRADQTKQLFCFVHSHPQGFATHSAQDDREEVQLFRTAYNRIKTMGVHASLVLSAEDRPVGRVWLEDGTTQPIALIRSIGQRFRFYRNDDDETPIPVFFDRQVRAFGDDFQRVLRKLHIGVAGVGGTGSAVCEQLIRLGVGKLTIVDGQNFEGSNVNRVYGSGIADEGIEKVANIQRMAERIGLGTTVIGIPKSVTYSSVVNRLKSADILFGCTDDQWGRSILSRMAIYYGIPVFDMGVKIDSREGILRSVQGRVTTQIADAACLFCRGRITEKGVREQALKELDPQQFSELVRQGYATELDTPSPAVVTFTSSVASLALTELIHRLTGFMGAERMTNELIITFDTSRLARNSQSSRPECYCGDREFIMRGDRKPLLDLYCRPEDFLQ